MGRGGEWLQLFGTCSCPDDRSLSNGQGTDSHTSSHVPNASCAVHSHASPNLTHTTPLRVGPGDPAVRPSCLPTSPQPLPLFWSSVCHAPGLPTPTSKQWLFPRNWEERGT